MAAHLAAQASKVIEEKKAEGLRPIGVATAKTDYSDNADCEDSLVGQEVLVSLVSDDERCYRVGLRVAAA